MERKTPKREIILNLYIFNENNEILAVERDEKDKIEQNVVTLPILYLPLGEHPVAYIKKYIHEKGLEIASFKMLKGIYLNKFDVEMEVDYLVLSFRFEVRGVGIEERGVRSEERGAEGEFKGDGENPHFVWMTIEEFSKHPKLMPEFQKNGFKKLLEGGELFYKGTYRESDGSFGVITMSAV